MNVSRSPVFSRLPTEAGTPSGGPGSAVLVPVVFLASALAHAGLFLSVASIAPRPPREKDPQVVRITDAKPPPPFPQVLEEKKPEPPPPPLPKRQEPKERKPRVRQDDRVKPPVAAAPPPEVRAGLSDSLAPGAGASGMAVAEGNSAEVAVDPEAARRPPPPPVAVQEQPYDPDAVVLTEVAVDTPSSCPSIGEVPLSEDAINAGVSSGKVVIEVVIASSGEVAEVKLLQGTGYGVDADVVARYKKLRCEPGRKGGQAARSRRKIELPIEL